MKKYLNLVSGYFSGAINIVEFLTEEFWKLTIFAAKFSPQWLISKSNKYEYGPNYKFKDSVTALLMIIIWSRVHMATLQIWNTSFLWSSWLTVLANHFLSTSFLIKKTYHLATFLTVCKFLCKPHSSKLSKPIFSLSSLCQQNYQYSSFCF